MQQVCGSHPTVPSFQAVYVSTPLPFLSLIPARPLFLLLIRHSSHFTQSLPRLLHLLSRSAYLPHHSSLPYLDSLSAFLFLPLILFSSFFFPPSCRNLVEPVLLRASEDGDHQPRPADHDQRGHHPSLRLGARAQRGLQAPRCRVDHRLQEHVRLSQVSSPVRRSACFYFGRGRKSLTCLKAPDAGVFLGFPAKCGRQLIRVSLRVDTFTEELRDVPADSGFYGRPTCVWRQVLHSWHRTSENL